MCSGEGLFLGCVVYYSRITSIYEVFPSPKSFLYSLRLGATAVSFWLHGADTDLNTAIIRCSTAPDVVDPILSIAKRNFHDDQINPFKVPNGMPIQSTITNLQLLAHCTALIMLSVNHSMLFRSIEVGIYV